MAFQIPKGVFDILPKAPKEAWKEVHLWQYLEKEIRSVCALYGFEELRTPIFERTELFERSVGEGSDIVRKEMYTFIDKAERSMTLRPEGTAAVMRSVIEKKNYEELPLQKFFYIAPMFRYERPQAGRFRQHHQFGVEVVGLAKPEQDVEVIELLYKLYSNLGLKNLKILINCLGSKESRLSYQKHLKEYLRPFFENLSPDSKERFDKNTLRIFDSKDPKDQEILENAPLMKDHLDADAATHFQRVCDLLETLQIPYELEPSLVRGLDYYSKTVFEIVSGDLGAQNTIGAGGRYDGLIETLGGPDLPAVGFGTGLERILQTMLAQGLKMPQKKRLNCFLIPMGPKAQEELWTFMAKLRERKISCQMDFSGKKLKSSFKLASQLNARYVLLLGDEELQNHEIVLKDMDAGDQRKLAVENAIEEIEKIIEKDENREKNHV